MARNEKAVCCGTDFKDIPLFKQGTSLPTGKATRERGPMVIVGIRATPSISKLRFYF